MDDAAVPATAAAGAPLAWAAPAPPRPREESDAAIAALREAGAGTFDPVRFRFIEALARRSAVHDGEARRLLDDRLAALTRAFHDDLAKDVAPRPPAHTAPAPLAELVAHLGRLAAPHGEDASTPAGLAAPPELKTLSQFRGTWSRLSADRRLTQALARVPGNAGPLNSHHLVHRALTLMRELSPAYLEHFMAQVDTLFWLDQATATGTASRVDAHAKGGRSKSG